MHGNERRGGKQPLIRKVNYQLYQTEGGIIAQTTTRRDTQNINLSNSTSQWG